jgi:hypothetical protein
MLHFKYFAARSHNTSPSELALSSRYFFKNADDIPGLKPLMNTILATFFSSLANKVGFSVSR